MSGITVTVSEKVWIDTEVDVDVKDIIKNASKDDLSLLFDAAARQGLTVIPGLGDGDDAHLRNILDQAERAVRSMAPAPRELLDLMYYVHGRAIA